MSKSFSQELPSNHSHATSRHTSDFLAIMQRIADGTYMTKDQEREESFQRQREFDAHPLTAPVIERGRHGRLKSIHNSPAFREVLRNNMQERARLEASENEDRRVAAAAHIIELAKEASVHEGITYADRKPFINEPMSHVANPLPLNSMKEDN